MYLRFRLMHRLVHAGVMLGVIAAALSGLPLRFSATAWAQTIVVIMGGLPVVRLVHRGAAILLGLCAVTHIGCVSYQYVWHRRPGLLWGPDSLVPQPRDWTECLQHLRWFLGKGPAPQFERWSYWQKFDYWAALAGMLLIGSTGVLVWFAPVFGRWLPGWFLTLCLQIHGHEAVLAVGVISLFHFFHTHLRPEKFPVDVAMFTGRIDALTLRREHPRYYARLRDTDSLAQVQVAPVARWFERMMRLVWVLPVGICWLLCVLMLWSFVAG